MKKIIFLVIILCISFSIKAQTKKETFNYINNKLSVYALDSNNIKYKYAIKESSTDNTILHADTFIISYDFSQFYSPLPIKEFIGITTTTNKGNIWFTLKFSKKDVKDFAITDGSVGNKKKFNLISLKDSHTFILQKNTTVKEIIKLKKAFKHLFSFYGVNNKELF